MTPRHDSFIASQIKKINVKSLSLQNWFILLIKYQDYSFLLNEYESIHGTNNKTLKVFVCLFRLITEAAGPGVTASILVGSACDYS